MNRPRKRGFLRTLMRFVGWRRRIFKRPQYVMGWDVGEDRDYWVKSRFNPDGTIEIIDHGCNKHKPANVQISGGTPSAESDCSAVCDCGNPVEPGADACRECLLSFDTQNSPISVKEGGTDENR